MRDSEEIVTLDFKGWRKNISIPKGRQYVRVMPEMMQVPCVEFSQSAPKNESLPVLEFSRRGRSSVFYYEGAW